MLNSLLLWIWVKCICIQCSENWPHPEERRKLKRHRTTTLQSLYPVMQKVCSLSLTDRCQLGTSDVWLVGNVPVCKPMFSSSSDLILFSIFFFCMNTNAIHVYHRLFRNRQQYKENDTWTILYSMQKSIPDNINKVWYIHTMEYHSARKRNELLIYVTHHGWTARTLH